MKKIAFIFPGQGAQYLGMGKEIIENNPKSRAVFDQAKEILDFDLEEVCFLSEEKINNTEYTQAALLTISIAILKEVEALGIYPNFMAGLSLGEYTALVANKSLNFKDAVSLVRKRGQFMEEAARKTKGMMAAVIGSSAEIIQKICENIDGLVEIANYNSSGQSVIAGEIVSVEKAIQKLEEQDIRVIPLKVSGAFHTSLMKEAANKLEVELEKIIINNFEIPYVTNVSGELVSNKELVKDLLVQQVMSPVKWENCVHSLIDAGVDMFIEIGPGKILSGLIKKIDKSKKIYNVQDLKSLNNLKEAWEAEKHD